MKKYSTFFKITHLTGTYGSDPFRARYRGESSEDRRPAKENLFSSCLGIGIIIMSPTYIAQTPYGVCTYQQLSNGTLKGSIQFTDLSGVSAVHIHSAASGNPILVWLATSCQWEAGVAQTTPLANAPCCARGSSNPNCSLKAPPGTPYTKRASYTTFSFCVPLPEGCTGETCPWTSEGTLLNFHGYDFQYMKKGCPSSGTPGADMILSVPFTAQS